MMSQPKILQHAMGKQKQKQTAKLSHTFDNLRMH